MNDKLEELINLYQKSDKKKWLYDHSNLILCDDKEEGNYTITIGVVESDGNYYEFLFIDNKESLLFKGLLYDTNDINKLNYDYFKNDLNNYNMNKLIEKYNEILKENFC